MQSTKEHNMRKSTSRGWQQKNHTKQNIVLVDCNSSKVIIHTLHITGFDPKVNLYNQNLMDAFLCSKVTESISVR
jgi:hypothetical protein